MEKTWKHTSLKPFLGLILINFLCKETFKLLRTSSEYIKSNVASHHLVGCGRETLISLRWRMASI
jgi:hypothetical protein